MFDETRRFSSPSGALLAYHQLAATGREQGILLICHGMVEHSRRYRRFAEAMASRGFHVYVHDHRGHGETVAPGASLGRFAETDGVHAVLSDVFDMADLTRTDHPDLPLILFGHSMGGLITLNALTRAPDKFQAAAIWNSNFNLGVSGHAARWLLKLERMFKGSDVPSGLLPRATFESWAKAVEGGTGPHDWLSHDAAEVALYAADPLCGFDASVSMWLDVLQLAMEGATPRRLATLPVMMPIHLVGGGKDPSTRGGAEIRWLAERLRSTGLRNVTCRIYSGMRHETLNEIGRDDATEDFADWCLTAVGRNRREAPAAPVARSLSETE